ncbi:cyclic nucleotide-binding domain-containing protein 2 [Monodelphis domestica]|uniref:Cyclic nucleotide-binding domain-containing protein 2 n=1 Tax=Monodelphis domestica TaxID=13616 RepID=F7F4M4_MONDO|nr:cyclic nucleotide-binding domain-containing protein 2 [Monodelphis domestica]
MLRIRKKYWGAKSCFNEFCRFYSRKYGTRGSGRHSKGRFKQLIKEIILMIRVCKIFREGLHGFREFQVMETVSKGIPIFTAWDKKRQCKLMFDYGKFTCDEGHFPERAIEIARKKPEWREESEVIDLCNFLKEVETFFNFSYQLQFQLAKVIRYERFDRRRVIIKKGHRGHSFYFIYLGSVAVTADEDGSSAFLDPCPDVLHKGSCFGEMALLIGSDRIATVVCMEDTELLVVDKEDFFGNDLDESLQREFRFRIDFFRQHSLFNTWPDTAIMKMATHCKVEKFPYGQLISRNGMNSGFIMFINKGTCDVVRLLDLSTCLSYHKWIWRQMTPVGQNLLDVPKLEHSPRKRFKEFQLKSYPVQDFSNLKMAHMEKIRKDTRHKCLKDSRSNIRPLNLQEKCFRSGSFSSPFSCPMVKTLHGPIPKDAVVGVYVKVHSLETGDIVGLHQYLIPDSLQDKRKMILISQGATVIRVRKDIFDELIDTETKEKVKEFQIAYPSDDIMCQKILSENTWNIFRSDLMKLLTKFPDYEQFTAFKSPPKGLYSPLSGILDLKSLGKEQPISYPIFHAKVDETPKKVLPPLRVVERLSAPRYQVKELLPKFRSPGVLLR